MTPLALNGTNYDIASPYNFHDNSVDNTKLLPKYAGIYHFTGGAKLSAAAAGFVKVMLRVNGGTEQASSGETNNAIGGVEFSVSTDYYMNVGDYMELCAYHTGTGASLTVAANASFSAEKVE